MVILCMYAYFLCSSGGVVLASEDGKIVLENTLDARLDVIFRQKLPEACSLSYIHFNQNVNFHLVSAKSLLFTINQYLFIPMQIRKRLLG